MKYFGTPKPTPLEQANAWGAAVRKQRRAIELQISKLKVEKTKTERIIKGYAQKNDIESCKVIAKQLINVKKTISRLHCSVAQLNSLDMTIKSQISSIRMCKALQKSTEVLQIINSMVNVRETHDIAMQLGKEMMKAGMIDEIIDETLNPPDLALEEQAEEVTDAALLDTIKEIMGGPIVTPATKVEAPKNEEAATENLDLEEMQHRLQLLKEL